ncbi:MAG: SGNH/GDSL hydrolase family protein [Spirochaetes bacterium]|nr:SGNH/GDSL hydrolase family protein [Spirochaetota bacterium]
MIKKIVVTLAGIIAACALLAGYVIFQAKKTPAANASALLRTTAGHDNKIVACLGDSITHGAVSFDYVGLLSDDPELKDYVFANEGINSRLAYNLLQVSDRVVALKPDYIFILIGTNDLKGSLSEEEKEYYNDLWHLPRKPTRQWFADNYRQLVHTLKTNTDAKIILISIPPLGENIDSAPFKLAVDYSRLIRELATGNGVSYIPFNEVLSDELVKGGKKNARPYSRDQWFMYSAILQHYLLCRDWNAISDDRGLRFLTDNIHLNERGGKILAALIKEALVSSDRSTHEH